MPERDIEITMLNLRTCKILSIIFILLCAACTEIRPIPSDNKQDAPTKKESLFEIEGVKASTRYASPENVREFSMSVDNPVYLIGPGDVLSLNVWGRPEVSAPQMIVGPDGIVTIPRIGFIQVNGRTRDDLAEEIKTKLMNFYSHPEISLSIIEYKNNKAFVLGRVENPGVVTFPGQGTLLEALSIAGGYSTEAEDTYLTKCAIIRGNNTIIWIDLNDLLQNGNMALNARIINNDVIFIPESQSELVYVMGEVRIPGAYNMTGHLTVLDSLMLAGGTTDDADTITLYLIRKGTDKNGIVKEINLKAIIESGDFSTNYIMEDDDILYVSEKPISQFNYVLENIFPSLEVIQMNTDILESFGVMKKAREKMWGQEE